MDFAINRANLYLANHCEATLPKVSLLLATVSVVALGILALNVATVASTSILATGMSAAIASMVALIGYIAAKNFSEKAVKFLAEKHPKIEINSLPKWNVKKEFEDAIDLEPIEDTAVFLVDDYESYKLESIQCLLEEQKQKGGLTRLLKKDDVDLTRSIYFLNLALVYRYKVCPLTNAPFIHPYICQEDGHTYERDAFIAHWKIFGTSPVTKSKIDTVHLYPNAVLYNQLDEDEERTDTKDEAEMGKDRPVVLT